MGRNTLEQLTLFDIEDKIHIKEGEEVKECRVCKEVKPIHMFSRKRHRHLPIFQSTELQDKGRSTCKACQKFSYNIVQELKIKHPRPTHASYACPICDKTSEELKSSGRWDKHTLIWCLDHCHKTLKFRGWICQGCNIGLSRFYDSIAIFKRGIKYLERKL
jgi:hypothetical protein